MFLDLKRAFDTIDRNLLLNKLHHYGIRDNLNDLIGSYLTNRSQYTQIEYAKSTIKPLLTGLNQGSVFSPLLFNIFINDLCNFASQRGIMCTLFADDTVFYLKDSSLENLVSKMQSFIVDLSEWLTMNKLTPNVTKTKLMFFGNKTNVTLPTLHFSGEILEIVQSFKYLGVIIDQKLNFKFHTKSVCNKLSQAKGIIYAASKYFDRNCLLLLYNSLAYSIIIQSIIIYGKTCDVTICYSTANCQINYKSLQIAGAPIDI